MRLFKVLTIFSFINVLSLMGCSNTSNNSDNLVVKYNNYTSYDELIEGLSVLQSNNPENETFLFDVIIDGFTTNYYVAGIDYRFRNPNFSLDKDANSEYLKTREVFYQLEKDNEDLLITIVFNEKIEFDKNDLYWSNEKLSFSGGTVLNYERNARGDAYYLRYDAYDDSFDLLRLKSNQNNTDLELIESIQDYLYKKI